MTPFHFFFFYYARHKQQIHNATFYLKTLNLINCCHLKPLDNYYHSPMVYSDSNFNNGRKIFSGQVSLHYYINSVAIFFFTPFFFNTYKLDCISSHYWSLNHYKLILYKLIHRTLLLCIGLSIITR